MGLLRGFRDRGPDHVTSPHGWGTKLPKIFLVVDPTSSADDDSNDYNIFLGFLYPNCPALKSALKRPHSHPRLEIKPDTLSP